MKADFISAGKEVCFFFDRTVRQSGAVNFIFATSAQQKKTFGRKFWGKFSSNGDPRFRHGKISKFHIWTQTYLKVQIARINIFIIIFCFSGWPEGGVRQQLCRHQR
jgi:hypothetical protein